MGGRPRVAVVGGGAAGASAAISLAARDLDVVLLERAPRLGGKMRTIELEGRHIDVGPTVITMRHVLDGLFEGAERRLEDYVELEPQELLARHAWDDGSSLDLFCDRDRSAEAIADFAGRREAEGYRRFVDYSRRILDACEAPFIESDDPSLGRLVRTLGVRGIARLSRLDSMRTMWSALCEFFSDPRLRQLFGRYATYYGSSPFLAPATLNLIAEVERRGVFRPKGGTMALAHAMERLALELGVELRCDCEVAHIETTSTGAKRVISIDGAELMVDAVVMNADVAAIAEGRFGPELALAVPRPTTAPRSLSAVTEALIANTSGFPLAYHNVFFPSASRYQQEFDDILVRRQLPTHPVVYVCASDRGGTRLPPRERLFTIVNAPAQGDTQEIPESELLRCSRESFDLLRRCGLHVDLSTASRQRTTPSDFARAYPGTGGALYGSATHSFRAPMQRPKLRTALPGLYLASGSVHPGAGVPMAVQSGRLAAKCLLEDLGSTRVRRRMAMAGGTSMA